MNNWSNNKEDTKMKKVIIIQCLDLNFSRQFQVQLPYDSSNRELDLGQALHNIIQQILNIEQQQQVFYFDPVDQLFVYAGNFPFKYPLIIGEDFIQQHIITVRLRKLGMEREHISANYKQQQNYIKTKAKRVNQRTIRQVIQKVSQWRQINEKNNKITLQQAAKIIGMSKKTLDDYFKHIKIGSEHGFNFQDNLNQKIGILRKFVKEKHMKKKNLSQLQFLDDLIKKQQGVNEQEEQQQEQ